MLFFKKKKSKKKETSFFEETKTKLKKRLGLFKKTKKETRVEEIIRLQKKLPKDAFYLFEVKDDFDTFTLSNIKFSRGTKLKAKSKKDTKEKEVEEDD